MLSLLYVEKRSSRDAKPLWNHVLKMLSPHSTHSIHQPPFPRSCEDFRASRLLRCLRPSDEGKREHLQVQSQPPSPKPPHTDLQECLQKPGALGRRCGHRVLWEHAAALCWALACLHCQHLSIPLMLTWRTPATRSTDLYRT